MHIATIQIRLPQKHSYEVHTFCFRIAHTLLGQQTRENRIPKGCPGNKGRRLVRPCQSVAIADKLPLVDFRHRCWASREERRTINQKFMVVRCGRVIADVSL